VDRELMVQDWDAFFDSYLTAAPCPRPAAAVLHRPSPLMPHLMFDWLRGARRALAKQGVTQQPLGAGGRAL
jgi:hypothetical protein